MGKIISVVNRKGGVGKTTLSIALADAFVTELKAHVAIVDLDPQASATRALLNDEQFIDRTENQTNLVALMKDRLGSNLRPKLSDYRQGMVHPFRDFSDVNLALYPNSDAFWDVEAAEIEKNGSINLTEQLLTIIQDIADKEGYDYVIVDCPPGQSASSLAALRASNLILCPVTTDKMALWGKDLLFKYIDNYVSETPVKFVASKVNLRTNAGRAVFAELQTSPHMLQIEGGMKGKGGVPEIARFSETTHVHKRFLPKYVKHLQNIYGREGANELRLIVNAIRREVGNG